MKTNLYEFKTALFKQGYNDMRSLRTVDDGTLHDMGMAKGHITRFRTVIPVPESWTTVL